MKGNEINLIDFVLTEVNDIYPNFQQYLDMEQGLLTGSTVSHLIYKYYNPSHIVPKTNDIDIFMIVDENLKEKFKLKENIIEDHYFPENEYYELFSTLYDKDVNITFIQENPKKKSTWINLLDHFDINTVQVGIDLKNKKIIQSKEYELFIQNKKICFSNFIKRKLYQKIFEIQNFPSYVGHIESIANIFSYLRILKKADEFGLPLMEQNYIQKLFIQLMINKILSPRRQVDYNIETVIESMDEYTISTTVGLKNYNLLKKYNIHISEYFKIDAKEDDNAIVSLNFKFKKDCFLFKYIKNTFLKNKDKSIIKNSLHCIDKLLRNDPDIELLNLKNTNVENINDEELCYSFITDSNLKNKILKTVDNENLALIEKATESFISNELTSNNFSVFLNDLEYVKKDSFLLHLLLQSNSRMFKTIDQKDQFIEKIFYEEFKYNQKIIINDNNFNTVKKIIRFDKFLIDNNKSINFKETNAIKEFKKFLFMEACI